MSLPDLRISGLRIKMCLGVCVRSGDATHYPGSGDTPTLRGLAPIINTSHIVLVNRLHLTWNAFLFFTLCSILAFLLSANVTIYFSFMSHKLTNFCVSLPPEPFAGFLRKFTPTVFLPWRNHWSSYCLFNVFIVIAIFRKYWTMNPWRKTNRGHWPQSILGLMMKTAECRGIASWEEKALHRQAVTRVNISQHPVLGEWWKGK